MLVGCPGIRLDGSMPAQQLRQILRKCRARQHHVTSHFVRLLLQVALHVREESNDRRPLFQLALQFRDERQRLGISIVQVEDDQRRLFNAVALHPVGEFLLGLHKLDLHIHLAARVLNLAQEEQVFDKREDARSGILSRSGKRLRIGHGVGRGKTGPSRSAVAVATIHAHIGAVAVIHGSGKNALMLLAVAAHRATRASFWRTPSTAPFVSPSACGGMSGSCIHIFLLLTLMLLPLAWIAGLIVSSFLAVGSLVGTLKRVAQRVAHCAPATGRPNPTSAGCYSKTLSKLSMSKLSGAWGLVWRERPALKHGHWEHLDVTHETSDCARGECL